MDNPILPTSQSNVAGNSTANGQAKDDEDSIETPAQGTYIAPGYSLQGGRSGYDPIAVNAEYGHVLGIYSQKLLSGQLRFHNAFVCIFMGLVGLMLVASALAGAWLTLNDKLPIFNAAQLLPFGLAGLLLLYICVKSLKQ